MSNSEVFVGCSKEFLDRDDWDPGKLITRRLHGKQLADGRTVHVNLWPKWFRDRTGEQIYGSLDLAAKTHDWAIFIFRADELRQSVEDIVGTGEVRDNVLFEAGLFYGNLPLKHVFILEETDDTDRPTARMASDVKSIQTLRYNSPETFRDSLDEVLRLMKERSTEAFFRWAPASSLAIGYFSAVIEPFVTGSLDKRRELRQENDFKVEVLLPQDDFSGVTLKDVDRYFALAGFVSLGAEGIVRSRPTLWAKKPERWVEEDDSTKRKNPPYFPNVYYDIPTTLYTADAVIVDYLTSRGAIERKGELTGNQADAFSSDIEGKLSPTPLRNFVQFQRFPNMAEVDSYLRTRLPSDSV